MVLIRLPKHPFSHSAPQKEPSHSRARLKTQKQQFTIVPNVVQYLVAKRMGLMRKRTTSTFHALKEKRHTQRFRNLTRIPQVAYMFIITSWLALTRDFHLITWRCFILLNPSPQFNRGRFYFEISKLISPFESMFAISFHDILEKVWQSLGESSFRNSGIETETNDTQYRPVRQV